jgi:hypothetical protein
MNFLSFNKIGNEGASKLSEGVTKLGNLTCLNLELKYKYNLLKFLKLIFLFLNKKIK